MRARTGLQSTLEGSRAGVGEAGVEDLGVAVDARLHLPSRHQVRKLLLQRPASPQPVLMLRFTSGNK